MSEWHTGWTEGYASARSEAQAEILHLREENEELRAALKPITDIGLTEARKVGLWSPKSVITMYVNYENLSAAAAALRGTTKGNNES